MERTWPSGHCKGPGVQKTCMKDCSPLFCNKTHSNKTIDAVSEMFRPSDPSIFAKLNYHTPI